MPFCQYAHAGAHAGKSRTSLFALFRLFCLFRPFQKKYLLCPLSKPQQRLIGLFKFIWFISISHSPCLLHTCNISLSPPLLVSPSPPLLGHSFFIFNLFISTAFACLDTHTADVLTNNSHFPEFFQLIETRPMVKILFPLLYSLSRTRSQAFHA